MSTQTIRTRIDASLHTEATKILDRLGLSKSEVIRLLLTRIVETGGLPDSLTKLNKSTLLSIREGQEILSTGNLRFTSSKELVRALDRE